MKKTYSLYSGKVLLEFDDSKHIYSVKGKPVYGVTSITGVLNKPALVYWAANIAAETFLANIKAGESLDEIQIKELADQIKTSHSKKKDASADLGTMIHDWLSEFLNAGISKKPLPKKPINPEMKNAVNAFLDWCKKNKVKFLETERKIYSKKYGYAGTLDAVAMVNGKMTLVDFKTSNAIYPEMFLQTVAYQSAFSEETGKKITHNLILRLSKENKEKGIEAFEVKETENYKENFGAFISCLKIYRWQMSQKKAEILAKLNGN